MKIWQDSGYVNSNLVKHIVCLLTCLNLYTIRFFLQKQHRIQILLKLTLLVYNLPEILPVRLKIRLTYVLLEMIMMPKCSLLISKTEKNGSNAYMYSCL